MRLFECTATYVRGPLGHVIGIIDEFPAVRVEAATVRRAREALFLLLAGVLSANRAAAEAEIQNLELLRREIIRPEARRNRPMRCGLPYDSIDIDEDDDGDSQYHPTDAELDRQAIHATSTLRTPFTAIHIQAIEGGVVSFVPELPTIHAEGKTIEESRMHLRAAVGLVLRTNCGDAYGFWFPVERIEGEADDEVDAVLLLKEPLDFDWPGAGPLVEERR
jgi:predicted RNase H-like HicB family nuclease